MKKLNQEGAHHIIVLLAVVVVAVVGLAGWRVLSTDKKNDDVKIINDGSSNKTENSESETVVTWQWNGKEWASTAEPPKCEEPVKFSVAPSELSKATSVLYPGQVRGGNYKPHGGLGFAGTTNDIEVKAIMDGNVTSGVRYIEAGETQYMFWIENPCGIAYRFDHLLTLSPEFQKIADALPEAKQDDSRTTNLSKPVAVKAGDTVATAVGFKVTKNVAYDLGVYDLRKPNEKGKDQSYRDAHKSELSQAAHALCWLDMFSASDSAKLVVLPSRDAGQGKTSDYCK